MRRGLTRPNLQTFMLTIKQDNLRILAIEHGRRSNNWLDDDCAQEAINQLQEQNETSDPSDVLDSLRYLEASIAYRVHPHQRSMAESAFNFVKQFVDTMGVKNAHQK